MIGLLVRRLVQLPLILGVVFVITFILAWVIPGNPLERGRGPRPEPAVQRAMQRQYNLQDPWTFAGSYLEGVFLHANFGPSLTYQDQTVSQIIGRGLPVSAGLGLAALGVGLVLGTIAGLAGAMWPRSPVDAASLIVALIGVSLPNFVTGSVLLVVFAGLFRWFPIGGWGSPNQLVLPALTLGLAPAAYVARLLRLGLAELMSADFIRTARAKGLGYKRALFSHALRVAYLPVLSFLGPAAAAVMTGSFVVEKVFAIPGLGKHFVDAVLNKDQFLILGVVLTYATILVVFNLVVDMAYAWLDPRIELG